jgi:hypothetical protein
LQEETEEESKVTVKDSRGSSPAFGTITLR